MSVKPGESPQPTPCDGAVRQPRWRGSPDSYWYDAGGPPRDQLISYARKVLAGSRVPRCGPPRQPRAACLHTAQEYVGRFLLELLQNADYTHPADQHDGQITIDFEADEGVHGTVYVANAGTPFTYGSMTGLCKLARSPKVVGEGIGYKGVGFRSVLPVCGWPEIYSADAGGPPGNLDGYSFRFARYADLLALTDGNEDLVRRADDEFPPFQIPVPVDSLPAKVRDLAAAGHVTVVRLPLDGPPGRVETHNQLDELAA